MLRIENLLTVVSTAMECMTALHVPRTCYYHFSNSLKPHLLIPQRLPVTEGLDVEQVCKARCQNCCIAMPSTATVFVWAFGPLAQLCNISIMLALLSTI